MRVALLVVLLPTATAAAMAGDAVVVSGARRTRGEYEATIIILSMCACVVGRVQMKDMQR